MARGSVKDWTRQRWLKETLVDFQKMIRWEAQGTDGLVQCVTCPARYHPKQMQAGHFVKRAHSSTAFDERNVNPQCIKCNYFLSGNDAVYLSWMVDVHGQGVVDELMKMKRELKTWTIDELKAMRAEYRRRWKAAGCKR